MRRLFRFFLAAFFESDLVAPGGDLRNLGVVMAALFAAPGMIIGMYLSVLGARIDPVPLVAFFIALAMLLVGILVVFEWDALFPSRVDLMILRPLPVTPLAILGAKLGALATLLAAFSVIVNLFSTPLVPLMTAPGNIYHAARLAVAQGIACVAASTWLFLLLLAAQGALLALGGETLLRRAGSTLQFALLIVLFTGMLLSPELMRPNLLRGLVAHPRLAVAPVLWFVGIYRWIGGSADPAWQALAHTGVRALIIAAAAAALFYAAGYVRQLRGMLAAPAGRHRAPGAGVRRLEGWMARRPRQRAVLRFLHATLTRSPRHRLILGIWLAVGAAFALEAVLQLAWGGNFRDVELAALAAPLILLFFLLGGLRHVFTIPVELPANWIFRFSETGPHPERLLAARTGLLLYGAVPVLLAAFPLSIRLWGWQRAWQHTAYDLVLALLLVEALLWRFRKLPFTCSYLPGKANIKLLALLYLIVFLVYAYSMSSWEWDLWRHPEQWVVAVAEIALVVAVLAWRGRAWRAAQTGCQFDDNPEELVQTLFGRD